MVLRSKFIVVLIMVSFVVANLMLMLGACHSFSAILLPQLNDADTPFIITVAEASWIASLGHIFRPVGSLANGYITEVLGRKRALQISFGPLIVGWAFIWFAQDVWHIYIGRTIISLFVGMTPVTCLYISEISKPSHRGSLASMPEIQGSVGIVSSYILGYYTRWRICSALFCIYCIINFVIIKFIPETHVWYMTKNMREKAVASLQWFRNGNLSEINKELDEIELYEHLNLKCQDRSRRFEAYKEWKVWKTFILFVIYFFFQQQSGYYPMISYSVDFFNCLGTRFDSYKLSIWLGSIQLFGNLVLLIIIDRYERKTFMRVSGIGICVTMLTITVIQYSKSMMGDVSDNCSWILLVLVFSNMFFYSLGVASIIWILVAEVFPAQVRGFMSSLASSICFIFGFAVIKIYPMQVYYMSFENILVYFTLCSFCTLLMGEITFPETRGKPLHKIFHGEQ